MAGKIYQYLADDYLRPDGLLERVLSDSGEVDAVAYAQFQTSLLKHIGAEKRVAGFEA